MTFEPGIIKAVATLLMGEPNIRLSSESELRFGTNGSLSIHLDKNTFYDHEASEGGGILDLILHQGGGKTRAEAVAWLKANDIAPPEQEKVKPRVVSSYDYHDESGELLFQVQRKEPKAFVQRRPVGDGWEYKVKGVRQVPYRLPELVAAPLSVTIYIVEGEKDADRLAALGLVATCNAGGAGKWRDSHSEHLKDRSVVLIADNDDAGRDHVRKVAKSLKGTAAHIRIMELAGLPEKGDVSDWLDAGGTREELSRLPTVAPAQAVDAGDDEDDEKKRSQTDMLVTYARENFELVPTHGGSMAPLWKIANIPEKLRLVVVAWLIDAMRPETPYPGLEFVGEQGSGKSTAAEALRRVLDPSSCNLRGAPKTVEDIFVTAGQNHLVAFENVSHLAGPMQDALAILSTGGGYSKRQLYTNDEEHIINVRRPWMVNGISIAVTQQDLVDRVISVECPVIAERQSSSKQWRDFETDLPGILGGLLDLAAAALGILPDMTLPSADRPRLVEFVLLGMAVAKASEKKPADFLNTFKELRAETVARTLDASPVAAAVVEFIESNPVGIEASVKDIMARLEHYKPLGAEAWPRSPKGLGDALRRASPALRQMGIECMSLGNIGGKVRWVIKRKLPTPNHECHEVMLEPTPADDLAHDFMTCMTSQPQVSLGEEVEL